MSRSLCRQLFASCGKIIMNLLRLGLFVLVAMCSLESQDPSTNGSFPQSPSAPDKSKRQLLDSGAGVNQDGAMVATDFNWSRKALTDLNVPGKKIINLSSCPQGVKGDEPEYWVYLSGTGEPESVRVAGGTCAGSGAAGTLKVETANPHAAGYTIGSASDGIQEASIAARFIPSNPNGSSQSGKVIVAPGEYNLYARTTFLASGQTVDFSGSIVNCYMRDTCLKVGDAANSNDYGHITLIGPRGRPMVTGGTYPFIEVNASTTRIFNVATRVSKAGGTFGTWVQVDDDQAFLLDGLDTSLANDLRCEATYCGSYITAPGPFNKWSAVGWVKHLNISANCNGNGVDWQSGNTVRIEDSVIQGFSQFGVRTGTPRGGYGPSELTNVYEEVGNCANPLGIGQAGVIVIGGASGRPTLKIDGGETPAGQTPTFANQPKGTPWTYYLVSRDVTAGNIVTAPWLVGGALLNGSGNVKVQTPQVTKGTDVIQYDLLRLQKQISGPDRGLLVGPFGTGEFAVLTASSGDCRNGVCTFIDTQAQLKTYVIAAQSWAPEVKFWPAPYVISGGASVQVDNYRGGALVSDSTQPAIFANTCGPAATNYSPAIITCIQPSMLINSDWQSVGTMLFRGGLAGGDGNNVSSWKGRLLFELNPKTSLPTGPEHIVTLVDCNPLKTLFTPGHRPGNDSCDSFIGLDAGNVNFDHAGIAFGAALSLSNYIGNVGDGTNWKERLTATQKLFKVPILTNSQMISTVPTGTSPLAVNSSTPVSNLVVANHPRMQDCGTTAACTTTPVRNGQIVFGSVTLSGGSATIEGLMPTFTDSKSFQCTASDRTTAGNSANALPLSASSIGIKGVGTDSISYICVGH
jgi:hypothetical protein